MTPDGLLVRFLLSVDAHVASSRPPGSHKRDRPRRLVVSNKFTSVRRCLAIPAIGQHVEVAPGIEYCQVRGAVYRMDGTLDVGLDALSITGEEQADAIARLKAAGWLEYP